MSLLTLSQIEKRYGQTPVLRGVDLTLEKGEIVCLLGPSGCGKSTLLRIVAGLEHPEVGTLHFDGEDLTRIPVYRRQFGLMFQEFALFPHKNVAENIAFGLRMQKLPRSVVDARVAEVLDLVSLQGYGNRSIFELSGGERQRVALARSLAPHPRLLMLDEPLGSLDRTLRQDLMLELRRILKRVGVSALYVTHDQQEAFAVADRVVVMHAGQFEQIGPPQLVYARPATPFVARFLGLTNLLPIQTILPDHLHVETGLGRFRLPETASTHATILLIRPEITAEQLSTAGDAGSVQGQVKAVSFRGSEYYLEIAVPASEESYTLDFVLPTRHRGHLQMPQLGDEINIGIEVSQLVLL